MKFFKTVFSNGEVAVGMFPDHITTGKVYSDLKQLLSPAEFELIVSICIISEREYIHTSLIQTIKFRLQFAPN